MKNVPCTVLKDYIGVKVKDHKQSGYAQIGELDNISVHLMELYDIEDGAFAWSEDADRDVIAFEKRLGKGKLTMLGAGMDHSFYYQNDVIANLAAQVGIESRFQLEDELDITVRSDSEGSTFFFLQNFDEYKKITTLKYKGQLLFGGKTLVIPPRSGLMLPTNVHLLEDITIDYGTGEIYHMEQEVDKLLLSLRVTQEEEEFVFISSQWIPIEAEKVIVTPIEHDRYKVVIQTRKDTESILFYKKD
jgi:beta-galactosidase